jgi:amidase
MENVYARINALNPKFNAIVNLLDYEDAMALAQQADKVALADRGLLHGLPMALKDAVETVGFPTTWGFKPFAARIATADDALAARLRAAGALFIGHTNMPEFGFGSNTFNSVFGTTLNPYNTSKTAGGSSGGAAVALATKMLPLADGSDLGGSLRNPASFCNVVGFRPSIGRMPFSRSFAWYGRMVTTGPMAKTVRDTTLLFTVMAGPDPADPLTLSEPGHSFFDALEPHKESDKLQIAMSKDLGCLEIAPEVSAVIESAATVFSDLGANVVADAPNLSGAMEAFQIQRAATLRPLGQSLDAAFPKWREDAKDTAIWNIEKGADLTAEEILYAETLRTKIYANVVKFFEKYDALILPAAQVAPFDAELEWVKEINGVEMTTYLDWMSVCCMITVTGLPAISVPAGFTKEGLPVGVQIVGKPRGDLALLQIALLFEEATKHHQHAPEI